MFEYIYKITNKVNGKAYVGKLLPRFKLDGKNIYRIPKGNDVRIVLFIEPLESMAQMHLM
jgi:hypothetical protein